MRGISKQDRFLLDKFAEPVLQHYFCSLPD